MQRLPNEQVIINLSADYYSLVSNLFYDNYRDSNRMVLISGKNTNDQLLDFAETFQTFNVVKLEIDTNGAVISRFEGPLSIFSSNDTNALLFRKQFNRWTGDSIEAVLVTKPMAPYSFMLEDFAGNGQRLTQIKDILNLSLKVMMGYEEYCQPCFSPMSVYRKRSYPNVFDYRVMKQLQM